MSRKELGTKWRLEFRFPVGFPKQPVFNDTFRRGHVASLDIDDRYRVYRDYIDKQIRFEEAYGVENALPHNFNTIQEWWDTPRERRREIGENYVSKLTQLRDDLDFLLSRTPDELRRLRKHVSSLGRPGDLPGCSHGKKPDFMSQAAWDRLDEAYKIHILRRGYDANDIDVTGGYVTSPEPGEIIHVETREVNRVLGTKEVQTLLRGRRVPEPEVAEVSFDLELMEQFVDSMID